MPTVPLPIAAAGAVSSSLRVAASNRDGLDTNFYKLLMLRMIRHLHSDAGAAFLLIDQSTAVHLRAGPTFSR